MTYRASLGLASPMCLYILNSSLSALFPVAIMNFWIVEGQSGEVSRTIKNELVYEQAGYVNKFQTANQQIEVERQIQEVFQYSFISIGHFGMFSWFLETRFDPTQFFLCLIH